MRTLLVVQWLRIRVPKQGICVRSLVEELRSHMLWDNQTSTSQLDKACALQRKPSTAKKKKKKSTRKWPKIQTNSSENQS